MARHKDINWNLDEGTKYTDGTFTVTRETIRGALLMDLRDELKKLNAVFACPNFTNIPHELRRTREAVERMERRLATKLPLPKGRIKSH